MVVHAPGLARSRVAAVEVAQVALQAHAFAERQGVHQAGEVLAVYVLQLRGVGGQGEVGRQCIGAAGEVEVVAGLPGVADVVAAGGVAQVGFGEAPGIQGQPLQLLTGEHAAGEGGGQQPGVVVHRHRQQRLQGAQAQGAFRGAQLGGQAQLAVVVHWLLRPRAERQQAGAAAVAAGIQLHAQLAQSIQAEANASLGEAGLEAGDETLAPFGGLGLGRPFLAEVAVDVDIAQLEAGLAIRDQVGGGIAAADQGQQGD
ncbi:hypothetical protein D3C84_351030 [compost metagenome]